MQKDISIHSAEEDSSICKNSYISGWLNKCIHQHTFTSCVVRNGIMLCALTDWCVIVGGNRAKSCSFHVCVFDSLNLHVNSLQGTSDHTGVTQLSWGHRQIAGVVCTTTTTKFTIFCPPSYRWLVECQSQVCASQVTSAGAMVKIQVTVTAITCQALLVFVQIESAAVVTLSRCLSKYKTDPSTSQTESQTAQTAADSLQ